MATYKITVSYGEPGDPDTFFDMAVSGLDQGRASSGVEAFMRDMLTLESSAVQRISIERESIK